MRSVLLLAALLGAGIPAHAQVTGAEGAARRGPATDPSTAVFWQELGDPTLVRLIGEALRGNHDLRAARASLDAASSARTEAALDFAPVITSSAGYSRQRLASAGFPGATGRLPDQDIWEAGLQVSWEIDVFGRQRNRLRAQNALVGSAEAGVDDAGVLLAAGVARAYFDLRGAEDRLAVARRNAENQRSTLELTQDRLELGRGNALDVERAQAQLSSTLASIPALEAEISAFEHRLAALLGRQPGSLAQDIGERAQRPTLPAELRPGDPEGIMARRPDVRGAEHELAARRAFVGEARADYLPRVSIEGVAGYTADAFDSLGRTGTPRYAVGPVLSWAFLDLGRVRTRVDAARADASRAAERYEQTLLNARAELETSLTDYHGAHERLQHLEAAAAASERATDLARLRFEEGATGFLEVLDAERTQLAAQDRLAAGWRDATTALVAVYRATGGQASVTPGEP